MSGIISRFHSLFVFFLFSIAQNSYALPVIQELYYDHPGTDSPGVFTELFGLPGFNLSGWKLVGINGSTRNSYRTITLPSVIIPSDGIFLISTNNAAPSLQQVTDYSANVDWQNGADAVHLIDPSGLIIDALQYGNITGFNAGEGSSAIDVSAGNSLSRLLGGYDTNDNFKDFEQLTSPSPGFVRTPTFTIQAVPEPNSSILIIIALVIFKLASDIKRQNRKLLGSAQLSTSVS